MMDLEAAGEAECRSSGSEGRGRDAVGVAGDLREKKKMLMRVVSGVLALLAAEEKQSW